MSQQKANQGYALALPREVGAGLLEDKASIAKHRLPTSLCTEAGAQVTRRWGAREGRKEVPFGLQ